MVIEKKIVIGSLIEKGKWVVSVRADLGNEAEMCSEKKQLRWAN